MTSRSVWPSRLQPAFDRLDVSRETLERCAIVVGTLGLWQKRINLVSQGDVAHLWERHVLDSLQLVPLAPEARSWIDLGSGSGFPGLVVASQLASFSETKVHLVESNAKKCAFLREAARAASLPVQVVHRRIETGLGDLPVPDMVSARALASLNELLGYSAELLKTGGRALFHKGAMVNEELTAARKHWRFRHRLHPSVIDPTGGILAISGPIVKRDSMSRDGSPAP
jgi:16S rRNA (guanine527-N7)-methyltransferase